MKKSLLIAPVLGILLVAAAGSVGGTVAWFSASSSWQTKVTEFSVTRLDGNLKCTMAGTVGTTAANDGQSVTIDDNIFLTHASYNIADGDVANANALLYSIDGAAEGHNYASKGAHGAADTAYTSTSSRGTPGNAWYIRHIEDYPVADTDTDVFYAVAWTMTFSYDFGADATPALLYFDPTSAIVNLTEGDDNDGAITKHTNLGFRIAFMNVAAAKNNSFVWAPNQTGANCKHVTGVDRKELLADVTNQAALDALENPVKGDVHKITDGGAYKMWDGDSWETTTNDGYNPASYTDYNLIHSGTTLGVADTNAIRSSDPSGFTDDDERIHPNYLGLLTPSDGAFSVSNNIVITCVAWFEGTDPNVVNDSTMDTLSANLKFFTHVAD